VDVIAFTPGWLDVDGCRDPALPLLVLPPPCLPAFVGAGTETRLTMSLLLVTHRRGARLDQGSEQQPSCLPITLGLGSVGV
jgi:hypothetical protein